MKLMRNVVAIDLSIDNHPSNSYATERVGALVGRLDLDYNGLIELTNIGGQVTLNGGSYTDLGLIGYASSMYPLTVYVSNWYAEIKGSGVIQNNMGGFIGNNQLSGNIELSNGYVAITRPGGADSASNINPIVGIGSSVLSSDVYVDNTTFLSPASPDYERKTTDEMMKEATFIGWDFETTWFIAEDVDYPRFFFASGITNNLLLWLFEGDTPPPVSIENEITEFRAGKTMYYRIYNVEDPDNIVDITNKAEIVFGAIEGSDVDPLWQVYADPDMTFIRVETSGELPIKIIMGDEKSQQKFEVYGPDYFEIPDKLRGPITKNMATRGQVKAIYRDEYEEILAPLPDFITNVVHVEGSVPPVYEAVAEGEGKIKINEASMTGLELGTHQLQYKRFMLKEVVDVEVVPQELPTLLEVVNTSATLYAFFQFSKEMDVDTYFSVRAFNDPEKTAPIVSLNTIDNVDNFTISVDGMASWQPIPQSALLPSGKDSEVYCAKVYVGPKEVVHLDVGLTTGDEAEDIYAPLISITPPPGVYNTPVTAVITINEPGDIFFAINEGIPDIPYAQGEPILLTKPVTLLVRAIDELGNASKIVKYKYVVDTKVPLLSAQPTPGVYLDPQNIQLISDEVESVIYYTTDGSAPTHESPIYTMPIPLAEGVLTIKAFAIDSAGNSSGVETLDYEVIGVPKGSSFGDPVIYNVPLGTEATTHTFGLIPTLHIRYDDFVIDAEYTISTVGLPSSLINNSTWLLWDSTQANIWGGWGAEPMKFTATTESMFITIDNVTDKWDPVMFVITRV